MEMGMVGLGRMGGNMVLRLLERGHRMVAFDQSPDAVKAHAAKGAVGANSLEEFVKAFEQKPRVMWVMVPAGEPTTQSIDKLIERGDPGDIIIDGGLAADPDLAGIKGWVEDTGEGRWTVEAAIDESVPVPIIAESLFARFRSRMENTFGDRMLAMMRNQFGGHAVVTDAKGEAARRRPVECRHPPAPNG